MGATPLYGGISRIPGNWIRVFCIAHQAKRLPTTKRVAPSGERKGQGYERH